ncbi:MAG: hypothetical protein ACFFDF_03025 [Candidatus Odinarchaeota archaeon]
MNFAIPRKNISEMLLYIWKIIDLPSISYNDLLFRISFDLFLEPPEKAKIFINKCVENNLLIKEKNQNLKLSKNLYLQIKNWQKERKIEILEKMKAAIMVTSLKNNMSKESTHFNILINAFVDKGTLNRSVSISDNDFEILEYDLSKGIIRSKVKGSQEEPYIIEIDTKNKILQHNCSDFMKRKAENKKFCKHLAKLFLLLKNKNERIAEFFLTDLAEHIDLWDFTT